MTFRQWISHIRQWWFSVRQFPFPWNEDAHMWVGVVGEREQSCMICGAGGMDRELSDEELERDKAMSDAYEKLHEEFFGEDNE